MCSLQLYCSLGIHQRPIAKRKYKKDREMNKIIDFGGWGFIETRRLPINVKFIVPKDYAYKESHKLILKCDCSEKGDEK